MDILEGEFARCGEVTDVYITEKGYAFVTMADDDSADLEEVDMEAVTEAATAMVAVAEEAVNAPNKGKSATRSSPPGGTTPINERGWYPYLSHSQNVMTVAELMYDQRVLLSLSSTLLLRNHSLSTTTAPLCIQRTHFTNVFL